MIHAPIDSDPYHAGWFECDEFATVLWAMNNVNTLNIGGEVSLGADLPFPTQFCDHIETIELYKLRWRHPDEVGRLLRQFPNAYTVSVDHADCYSQATALDLAGPARVRWNITTVVWIKTRSVSDPWKRAPAREAVARWISATLVDAQIKRLTIDDNLPSALAILVPAWHRSLTVLEIDFTAQSMLHPASTPWARRECIVFTTASTTSDSRADC